MKTVKIFYKPYEKEVEVKFRIVVRDRWCDGHFSPLPPFYPLEYDFDTKEAAEKWKQENEKKYIFGEICIEEILQEN